MTWEEEQQKEAEVTERLIGIAHELGFEAKPIKNGKLIYGAVIVDPLSGKGVYSFWIGHFWTWRSGTQLKKMLVYSPDRGYKTLHDAKLYTRRILRTYAEKRLAKLDSLVAELEESYQSRNAVRRELIELAHQLGFRTRLVDYINPELDIFLGNDKIATVVVKDANPARRQRPILLNLKKPGTFVDRDHYSFEAAKERLERHLHEWLDLKADGLDSLAAELGESAARHEIDRLIEGRDDIDKLNIPPSGKRYARMKGLKAVTPPNKQNLYVKMVADLVNRGVTKGFKNRDAGEVQHV